MESGQTIKTIAGTYLVADGILSFIVPADSANTNFFQGMRVFRSALGLLLIGSGLK